MSVDDVAWFLLTDWFFLTHLYHRPHISFHFIPGHLILDSIL